MGYLITVTGKVVDPLDMKEDDIVLEDIAHALSHICRYAGHTPVHYSVAQHSILCAEEMYKRASKRFGVSNEFTFNLVLQALLHDATEAYVSDVPRPVKTKEFSQIEDNIWEVMARKWNLPKKHHSLVKEVDIFLLHSEMKCIFNHLPEGAVEQDFISVVPDSDPMHVYNHFISCLETMLIDRKIPKW